MKSVIKIKNMLTLSAISLAMAGGAVQAAVVDCTNVTTWQENTAYSKGELVQLSEQAFESQWWNKSNPLEKSGPWQEWKKTGDCDSGVIVNLPPFVSWNSPLTGTSFVENDSVVFDVNSSDEDGTVS